MSDWISYDNTNKRFILEENLGGARTAKVVLHLVENTAIKNTWIIHQKAYGTSHIDYITIAGNDVCYWGDEYVIVVTASGTGITEEEMEDITLSIPSGKGLEIIDSEINGNIRVFRISTPKKISIDGSIPSESLTFVVSDGEESINKTVSFKAVEVALTVSGDNVAEIGSKYTAVVKVSSTPYREWTLNYVQAYFGDCGEAPEPTCYNSFTYTPLEISSKYTYRINNVRQNFNNTGTEEIEECLEDMRYMFCECKELTTLDLSELDTSNVTNMSRMFDGCYALTSLDISGWNTSKVTNMSQMFYECKVLPTLDISGLDTSNVTNMENMFTDCYALTSLDVSGFNTSNVTDMEGMFISCELLTSLDVSGWDTSKVNHMESMFSHCYALTSLDLSNWNTYNVTGVEGMFAWCTSLTTLCLDGWDLSNVLVEDDMFLGCSALTTIYASGCNQTTIDLLSNLKPSGCTIITE